MFAKKLRSGSRKPFANPSPPSSSARRDYLNQLSVQTLNGNLYNIRFKTHLRGQLGRKILGVYGDNVALAVVTEYPDYHWQLWRFCKSTRQYWIQLGQLLRNNDPIGQAALRDYLIYLAQQLDPKANSLIDLSRLISDRLLENQKSLWKTLSVTDIRHLAQLGFGPEQLPSLISSLTSNVPLPTQVSKNTSYSTNRVGM